MIEGDSGRSFLGNPTLLFVFGLWMVTTFSMTIFWEVLGYRKRRGGVALLNVLISSSIWTTFVGASYLAKSIAYKTLWMNIAYIGLCAIPPYAFLLGRMFPVNRQPLPLVSKVILGLFPVITVVFVFTNHLHGWVWSSAAIAPTGQLIRTASWWFDIYVVHAYVTLGVTMFYFVRAMLMKQGLYHKQARNMVLAMIPPIVFNILYLLHVDLGRFLQVDYTPLAFGLTAIGLALNYHHFNFIKIRPVHRDGVLENMRQGLLVVDNSYVVRDMNQAFVTMVKKAESDMIDRQLCEIFPQYEEQLNLIIFDEVEQHHELLFEGIGWLDVHVSPLQQRRLRPPGWIVLLDNISDRKHVELALNGIYDELQIKIESLEQAQHAIHTLGDLLPICQQCGRKIQQEDGTWIAVDRFIETHSEREMTHGICPECYQKYFG